MQAVLYVTGSQKQKNFSSFLWGSGAKGVGVGLGARLFQAVDWALYAQSTLWV